MPIRIANHAITVVRGSDRFELKAGEGFEMTKDEIKQFNELNPDAFRLPLVQNVVVVGGSENTVITEGEGEATNEDKEPTEEDLKKSGTQLVKKPTGRASTKATDDKKANEDDNL